MWLRPRGETASTLDRARRGSVDAFNEIVRLHQGAVYGVCYRTLGNPEDAADATQDAFLNAFRAIGSYRGDASGLVPWLLRIAVNACFDLARKRRRRPAESMDQLVDDAERDGFAPPQFADSSPTPEQRALTSETARAIESALDTLSVEHRAAVVLCDVQGLSYEEAARALGVELGTLKSRLSRARAHLRDQLTARGELPVHRQRLPSEQPYA